jgi:hypothetical protein
VLLRNGEEIAVEGVVSGVVQVISSATNPARLELDGAANQEHANDERWQK